MRTSIKCILAFFALVAILGLALTLFSDNTEARTCVWDGDDAGALASTATNWDIDTAPIAGDNILFDGLNATADDPCQWDLSTNSFGTFTIGAGYSGTITQSSDMYIAGYSQAGGTFTGATTEILTCSGNWVKSGGTTTSNVLNLKMTGDSVTMFGYGGGTTIYSFTNTGVITTTGSTLAVLHFDNQGTIYIGNGLILSVKVYNGITYHNDGTVYIPASGRSEITVQNADQLIDIGHYNGSGLLRFSAASTTTSDRIISLSADFDTVCNVDLMSSHATYTCTLDLNGHSLTASSITVGTRGILKCGEDTITTGALTSTSGTILEETATWEFVNATVTSTSGEKFYNVHMNGWVDFASSVNVTNELMFVNVPSEYDDLDVYLDTVYSQTIPSPYTFGPEITSAAKYEYEPDVQIEISQFYEDTDFSIYAYISSNLPVTYNITGTASDWLSYHEGRIIGMPPDIGNYTYTITATHESGSVDIVSGHILVGQLDTAEYNFDFVWGLLLWSIITIFMVFGYLREIPLMQMVVWAISFGNIVATIRIENFGAFVALFAICNTIIFFIGMARWRS